MEQQPHTTNTTRMQQQQQQQQQAAATPRTHPPPTHDAAAATAAAAAGLGPMLQAAMAQYTAAAGVYVREAGPPAHSPQPIPTSLSATSPYVSSGSGSMMSFPTPRGGAGLTQSSSPLAAIPSSIAVPKPQPAQHPAASPFHASIGSSSGGGVSLQHLADSPLSQSVGGPAVTAQPTMPQRSPSHAQQQQRPANLSVASTPRSGAVASTVQHATSGSTPHNNPTVAPLADQPAHPLPDFLRSIYSSSAASLAEFDRLIHAKVRNELGRSKLRRIEVVVGIPFYTELANIHSVLVTLRDVFQRRKQRTLVVILGEFARQDCIQDCISECADIERGESWEQEGWVSIETMWKPHPKYASKPWTVRALQIIASQCGGARNNTSAAAEMLSPDSASSSSSSSYTSSPPTHSSSASSPAVSSSSCVGAHLIIADADIQFNHFELSAQSLVHSLLDPLQSWPAANTDTTADAAQTGRCTETSRSDSAAAAAAPVARQCLTLHTDDQSAAAPPYPPRLEHKHQPLFPSPLPLSLASAGAARGSGLDDDEAEQERHDAAAAEAQAQADSNAEADAEVTFSPVFAVRTPSGYPADLPSASPLSLSSDPAHLKDPPPPALLVVLNAPRSFFSDDAIVHLVSYLHSVMSLGLEVHQSHGGEFSLHRDLNAHLLSLQTIVYDRTYCVEAQLANRAAMVHPATHPELFPSIALPAASASAFGSAAASAPANIGCSVLEVLMKGKWHAKITLGKLLAFESGAGAAAAAAASNPSYPAPAPPAAASAAAAAGLNPSAAAAAGKSAGSRVRIDLVSEKLLNEAVYWSSLGIVSPIAALQQQASTQQLQQQQPQPFRGPFTSFAAGPGSALSFDDLSSSPSDASASAAAPPAPAPLLHHVGGLRYVPSPDPKAQSLRVLAPTCTRKQMLSSLKSYHQTLLLEHVSTGHLEPESRFVTRFLPLLQQQVVKRSNGVSALSYIVSFARASARPSDPWHESRLPEDQRERFVVFGPREWAAYTVELMSMYKESTKPEQRLAVICAHRLVWLLGCIAFLNDHSHCLWGHMHSTLHQIYAPVFRRTYLVEFMRLPIGQVEEIMRRERIPPRLPQRLQQPAQAHTQAADATQSPPAAAESSAEVPASLSDALPPSMPPSPQPHAPLPLEQQQLFAQMTARIASLEAMLAQHEADAATAAAAAAAASSAPPSLSISPSEALKDEIVHLFAQQQDGEQRGY